MPPCLVEMRSGLVCFALATASAFITPSAAPPRPARAARAGAPRMSIFDLSAAQAGKNVPLSTFSDKKAILVVNVASI